MKVPILESWGFSQFNCPDWPCSGVCTHQWWREEQLQIFQLTWAQVELTRFHFYFTATLGQTFFYRHKLLTFSEREITASQITEAACHLSKIGRPRFALEISWGSSWARACNILLGGTRLDLGHLHKPGPMWSSPGLSSQGWRVGDGAGWMPIGSSRINQTVHKYDRPWPLLLREASLFDVTFSL